MDLYQVCTNYAHGAKIAHPGDYMFYKGLYRENMKKSTCLKPQGLEPRYLVFSIT